MRLKTIEHFFEHYKDLEPGKWVKVQGWEGRDAAHKEILDGIANYEKAQKA
jgi:inorganic pyrophosphatase